MVECGLKFNPKVYHIEIYVIDKKVALMQVFQYNIPHFLIMLFVNGIWKKLRILVFHVSSFFHNFYETLKFLYVSYFIYNSSRNQLTRFQDSIENMNSIKIIIKEIFIELAKWLSTEVFLPIVHKCYNIIEFDWKLMKDFT